MPRHASFLLIAGFSLLSLGCEASKAVDPTSSAPIDTSKVAKDTTKAAKDTAKTPVVTVQPVLPPTDSIVGPAEGSVNGLPTVTTLPLTLITRSTVKSGGEIVSEGGSPILHKGMILSPKPRPVVNTRSMEDTESDLGSGNSPFTLEMQGLTPGTTYYIRSYATNSAGTAYGPEHKFTTTALTFNPGTCSPEINTIDYLREHYQFYAVTTSTRSNTHGNFTMTANSLHADVSLEFLKTPAPGIYTTVGREANWIKASEVMINGQFGPQMYMALTGDTVRVEALPSGKFSATFCSLKFSTGSTSKYDFATGGNLTEK
ncbi:MAG: hypothetical protein IPK50_07055 [Fibrobacterota bacterium]|nr:MAG: hypothetical protein IPK50_07055 [Fibrobacterota bacterium]